MGQHLFLTGYRGTGKSSVGAILSTHLGWPLVDLDDKVQRDGGQSITEMFRAGGEELFRQRESAALAAVVEQPRCVVALGGGAIVRESNRQLIRTHGDCFWLDADPETLAARIEADARTADQRPALTALPRADEVHAILQQRRPLYQAAADHRIDTTHKSVPQVADEILAIVRGRSGFCQTPSSR